MIKAARANTTDWWKTEGVLGGQYRFKKDLVADIRGVINPHPLNTPMGRAEQAFLMDVLKHHHDWPAKRGCGVAHIEVRMNPGTFGSTRGLWLVRTDGSEIDISWVVALKPGGQSSPKENVCAAARREVMGQVLTAREEQILWPCSICGNPLHGSTHVDHKPPYTFDRLLTEFIESKGLTWAAVEVEDLGIYGQFKDRGLAEDWQQYHYHVADLRLIHKHENLGAPRT